MTSDEKFLGDRMDQFERQVESSLDDLRAEMRAGFAEMKLHLLGDFNNPPKFVRRDEFIELEREVRANTKWREGKDAQARMVDWLVGGGFVTLLVILYALARYFSGA